MKHELIINRIEYLLTIGGDIGKDRDCSPELGMEVYSGTLNLVTEIYGVNSPLAKTVKDSNSRIMNYPTFEDTKSGNIIRELRGVLRTVSMEVKGGLLVNIISEAKAEILADFTSMAKLAITENSLNVASVLSCAALEDTLKRFAENNAIEVEGKDLSEILNAIKAGGYMKSTQAKIVKSFIKVRNNALHADWDKIDISEIQSILGFLDGFLSTSFLHINSNQ